MAGKLKTLPAKAIQKAIDAYGSDFQGLKVLNHGDFWTNNVMYKYNNNELIDAIFVGFWKDWLECCNELLDFYNSRLISKTVSLDRQSLIWCTF